MSHGPSPSGATAATPLPPDRPGPHSSRLGLVALVATILLLGAAVGAAVGGRLSDRWGRRTNILMLACIFFVGTMGCVLSPNYEVLVVFRFVLGLAVGGASV